MITKEQLIKLGASESNALKYVDSINKTLVKFNINTKARICSFLCQIFEETGNLQVIKENLNYSSKRLMQVWPSRFPTIASTNGYVMNPINLAEKVYGGRGGNPVGEAGKYIGRGMIQLTFYNNYKECGDYLKVDFIKNPLLLEEPIYACLCAGWFWNKNNLNKIADIDTLESVTKITKIINGGYTNLETRQKYWKTAKTIDFNLNNEVINNISEVKEVLVSNITEVKEVVNNIPENNKSNNLISSILQSILLFFKK